LAKIIKKLTPEWGIGKGSVREIDSYGIVKATEKAMRRAIRKTLEIGNWKLEIPKRTMFVLVDGFHVKYIPAVGLKNQKGIPHGDQKSLGIAAASILAKDYRDGLMRKLSLRYPQYGWDQNKGYGTKRHRLAISRYGRTPLHRKKFVETFLKES
jgi:ribonuclease HII